MSISAKYVHTNLIARDWKSLANFYQTIFGCIPVLPERDSEGDKLDAGTGLKNARLRGMHLRLPGFGDDGPTLEIYNYSELAEAGKIAVNRLGFGHIAFSVKDVESAQKVVLDAGGKKIGEVVTLTTSDGAKVTWCYVTDPEGNIVELQSWAQK